MQAFKFERNGVTLIDQWAVWWLATQVEAHGPQMAEFMKLEAEAEGIVNNAMGFQYGAQARRDAVVRHSKLVV